MILYLTYAFIIYVTWYLISRIATLGAWLYSKPGKLGVRHYSVIAVSLLPMVFEVVATTLIIFAIGFGIDPPHREPNIYSDSSSIGR